MVKRALTDEQGPPATSRSQRTLVIAAPGSGKTFMAVERFGVLRYNHHEQDHRGVAAVSFARSASEELLMRIRRRWGGQAVRWPNRVSTFDELHRSVLRHLLDRGLLTWPNGHTNLQVKDSWGRTPGSSSRLKKGKPWLTIGIDDGNICIVEQTEGRRSTVVFVKRKPYEEQLGAGVCTHDEVRAALAAALGADQVEIRQAICDFLATSYSHLVVDEIYDLNELDLELLSACDDAGVGLSMLGDPWQTIYEFRGSRPDLVKSFADERKFDRHEVVGSHRYKTVEMQQLAKRLVEGDVFSVAGAEPGRIPTVVLARRWSPLWDQTELPVIPSGCGGKLDQTSPASAAFVLLLNEVTTELFNVAVTGFGEAQIALRWDGDRGALREAREALATGGSPADIWKLLHALDQSGQVWPEPKVTAAKHLDRLIAVLSGGPTPILGTSVHQAKGLQWPHVDVLDPARAFANYRLRQDSADDRLLYVALTRAEETVRMRSMPYNYPWYYAAPGIVI
ncbi:MAG TPA: UvrD-helicase domain-containing protein [Ilumatobacteraceae bacterium]|nr:UvrD-helicase domain-containing protein [Ilumatobacteraceae bacterium]